jgi:hypothetical protein
MSSFIKITDPQSDGGRYSVVINSSGIGPRAVSCCIQHNLGSEDVIVQCYQQLDNTLFIPDAVHIVDLNTVVVNINRTVTFKCLIFK